MAFDAFLKFEGGPKVEGESNRKGFEKQIDVFSFSFGASNPSSIGMSGGGGTGKAARRVGKAPREVASRARLLQPREEAGRNVWPSPGPFAVCNQASVAGAAK